MIVKGKVDSDVQRHDRIYIGSDIFADQRFPPNGIVAISRIAHHVDLGSECIQSIPQAPAHTHGGLAIFLISSNMLVMGDLFTNGGYPVIDESSGGTLRGMIETLERLTGLPEP